MQRDPFELSQYTTSFDKQDVFEPDALIFADFEASFTIVVEQIRARQKAVSVGFSVPEFQFVDVEGFNATTPAGVVDAILLFQQAVEEFVTGSLIESFGRLSFCDNVYIGFFHFENGFPIVGLSNILPSDQADWSKPPDPNDIESVVTFTQSIGDNLNEIIFALNVLEYIHGRMVLPYRLDDSCGGAPPTTAPTAPPPTAPPPTAPPPTAPPPTAPPPTAPPPTAPPPTAPPPTAPPPTAPPPTAPPPTAPPPTAPPPTAPPPTSPPPTSPPPPPFIPPPPLVPGPGPGVPQALEMGPFDSTRTLSPDSRFSRYGESYGLSKKINGDAIDEM